MSPAMGCMRRLSRMAPAAIRFLGEEALPQRLLAATTEAQELKAAAAVEDQTPKAKARALAARAAAALSS